MLRKYNNSRSHSDNIKLGTLSAFSAGMVNIGSLLLFLSFSSNITGHYAILASEIVKGNLYQIAVVFGWIFLFFFGSFVSNLSVIHLQKNAYLAHSIPLLLEMACLVAVGVYGEAFYAETLYETEILLAIILFAMGLQNGLTASISNFAIKTTHLTGITTDLGILFSMFTKKEFRQNAQLKQRAALLLYIVGFYLMGALIAGFTYSFLGFRVFYLVSVVLAVIIIYDLSKLRIKLFWHQRKLLKLQLEKVNSYVIEKDEKSMAS
ncbi:MAG: YoaK family protein [Flavobacterium sp.]